MPTTVPTDEEIRLRAYRLWEVNGRQDGRDLDYWLQAAMELEDGVIAGGAMQHLRWLPLPPAGIDFGRARCAEPADFRSSTALLKQSPDRAPASRFERAPAMELAAGNRTNGSAAELRLEWKHCWGAQFGAHKYQTAMTIGGRCQLWRPG